MTAFFQSAEYIKFRRKKVEKQNDPATVHKPVGDIMLVYMQVQLGEMGAGVSCFCACIIINNTTHANIQ